MAAKWRAKKLRGQVYVAPTGIESDTLDKPESTHDDEDGTPEEDAAIDVVAGCRR
jgi:hypothetical protein